MSTFSIVVGLVVFAAFGFIVHRRIKADSVKPGPTEHAGAASASSREAGIVKEAR